MTTTQPEPDHRGSVRTAAAVAFAAAASVLSATFDWPDILREPASVVLPAFLAGGSSLVWTWFATAWTYALLAVPMLLLPAALGPPRTTRPCGWPPGSVRLRCCCPWSGSFAGCSSCPRSPGPMRTATR